MLKRKRASKHWVNEVDKKLQRRTNKSHNNCIEGEIFFPIKFRHAILLLPLRSHSAVFPNKRRRKVIRDFRVTGNIRRMRLLTIPLNDVVR